MVVSQTDKSGKMTIHTPANYAESAKPHISNDQVITEEEYKRIEKETNAHAVFWLEILKVAQNSLSH